VAKLLRTFGSAELVRQASLEELSKVVGPAAARRVVDHYSSAVGQVSNLRAD
jgi:excinuclease UvrABC nuclease subunit